MSARGLDTRPGIDLLDLPGVEKLTIRELAGIVRALTGKVLTLEAIPESCTLPTEKGDGAAK